LTSRPPPCCPTPPAPPPNPQELGFTEKLPRVKVLSTWKTLQGTDEEHKGVFANNGRLVRIWAGLVSRLSAAAAKHCKNFKLTFCALGILVSFTLYTYQLELVYNKIPKTGHLSLSLSLMFFTSAFYILPALFGSVIRGETTSSVPQAKFFSLSLCTFTSSFSSIYALKVGRTPAPLHACNSARLHPCTLCTPCTPCTPAPLHCLQRSNCIPRTPPPPTPSAHPRISYRGASTRPLPRPARPAAPPAPPPRPPRRPAHHPLCPAVRSHAGTRPLQGAVLAFL
jgi:hypothetical protein